MKAMCKILEKEWKNRIHILESGENLPATFQRNLFYDCRTATIKQFGENDVCDFKYFKYTLIYKMEAKYGYSREELKIKAKPDATLYRRNGVELIQYEHRFFPCMAIIATEKSGIAEALASVLVKYGVAIVDTQGNQGRYAIQFIEKRKNIPTFCINDMDITGCFMSQRFEEVGAVRIDLLHIAKMVGLNTDNLWEDDFGGHKSSHFKSISQKDKDLLKSKGGYRRIELDTIIKHSNIEDFSKAIIGFLDEKIPEKDMSVVMEMGEWIYIPLIPEKEKNKIKATAEKLGEKYKSKADAVLDTYTQMHAPFEDLELDKLEQKAREEFEEGLK